MSIDTVEIHISVDTPDRRVLLARLCAELDHALARDERWERDDAVVPWHAAAPRFADLPARVVAAVLDEWEEVDACLAAVEFSGYLETEQGPRAWGCLTVHEGRPRTARPALDTLSVEEGAAGCRLEARLRLGGTGRAGGNG
jgi:hypothetical protein